MNTEQKWLMEFKQEARLGQVMDLSPREKSLCKVIDRLADRIERLEKRSTRSQSE